MRGLEKVLLGRVGAVEEESEQDALEEAEGPGRQEQVGQGDTAARDEYSLRSREEIRPRVEAAVSKTHNSLAWGFSIGWTALE